MLLAPNNEAKGGRSCIPAKRQTWECYADGTGSGGMKYKCEGIVFSFSLVSET